MCAIAGRVEGDGRNADRALVEHMTKTQVHRGPDAGGFYADGPCALGHRRLSIIDLAAGAQPMGNEDGSVQVVFNGEIYNHADLRAELVAAGHTFATRADTEVLVHGYEAWGEQLPERLCGMFALAIWDTRKRRLFLARDRVGIKPLYFAQFDRGLSFASEPKALLCDSRLEVAVDEAAIDLYLSLRYVPGPRTAFAAINKLLPGHLAVYERGKLSMRRYWEVHQAPLTEGDGRADESLDESLAQVLHQRTRACVTSHLMSDVPVGVFLSGGLDSSSVAAMMVDAARGGKVTSFAVGYPAADGASELDAARTVAEALGTRHREVTVTAAMFGAAIGDVAWYLDEPIADAACISLYYLAKRAREEVTVVLSGEGADEILGGYPIYRRMLALERSRELCGSAVDRAAPLIRFLAHPKLAKYATWLSQPLAVRYRGVSVAFSDAERARFGLGSPLRAVELASEIFSETAQQSALERMLEFDRRVWLPDDLLVKADKMTMAASLELRVPFLDHCLLEWCTQLPGSMKIRGGVGKWLLRRAMRHRLAPAVINGSKKGFTVPLAHWLRTSLHDRLRDELSAADGYVRERCGLRTVVTLLDEHRKGAADRTEELWALWMLQTWHRRFIGAEGRMTFRQVG